MSRSIADRAPLIFHAADGRLVPATAYTESAMRDIRGRVTVEIKGGRANQRRRGLYWVIAGIVADLLNDQHGLTLDQQDLHDITRDKLGLVDVIRLPSGDELRKRRSTSNRAMNEHERAEFVDRALALWATWVGVGAPMLLSEGRVIEGRVYGEGRK